MKKLKKQFGAQFVELLQKSPTLVKDLEDIRDAGVTIRRIKSKHFFAESNPIEKVIWISYPAHPASQLTALAHEKYHVLGRQTPVADSAFITRQQFIRACLSCELGAKKAELVVARELQAAGVALDSHTLKWLKISKKGEKAMREEMNKAVTSTTGETYREYYGEAYDQAVENEYE